MFRRFDRLEDLIRNPNQSAITPPDSDYDLKFRRNSVDLEHPKALDPGETNATESPENNLPYRLHKVADVPFRFPTYLRQGLTYPGVPFPIVLRRTLPIANPRDIDRYLFLHPGKLTRDCWIDISKRYIFGFLSWIHHTFETNS